MPTCQLDTKVIDKCSMYAAVFNIHIIYAILNIAYNNFEVNEQGTQGLVVNINYRPNRIRTIIRIHLLSVHSQL